MVGTIRYMRFDTQSEAMTQARRLVVSGYISWRPTVRAQRVTGVQLWRIDTPTTDTH
jgi:hypothetical protein